LFAFNKRPLSLKSSLPKRATSPYVVLVEITKRQKPQTPDAIISSLDQRRAEMANKQSIQDVDAALDRWHRKLNMCVTKINELRDKRKKLIKGYIKHPPPKGVKVMLSKANPADFDFDDVVPSFGSNPTIGG
jgi:hypothetical protein